MKNKNQKIVNMFDNMNNKYVANIESVEDDSLLEHSRNPASIPNSAEERLQRYVEEFKREYSDYKAITPTFAQLAKVLMNKRNWNSDDFMRNTRLDASTYNEIISDKPVDVTLQTVTAFCVGIGASGDVAKKLIAAAGFTLNKSKESFAYHFVMTEMIGYSFDECNMFLEGLGVEQIGEKKRNPMKTVNK